MSLLKNLLSVSGLTLVSRIFGMLRDVTISVVFGSGILTDAFVIAFRIPNLFRSFFAEGAFSQAFVPTLSKVQQKSLLEEKEFINNTFGLLALASGLVAITGSVFSLQVAEVFAGGYNAQQVQVVSSLLKITFPYIFFISLTAFVSSILQCHNHFFIPAFSPVLLNISLIFFAIFISDFFVIPITSLAWAIILAGVLQFGIQIFPLAKIKRIPLPIPSLKNKNVRRTLLLMIPIVLSSSISQISMTVDSMLATYLETGTVFWLYLGNRVTGLPLGVFGVSIAIIILPSLSRENALGNKESYQRILRWGMHFVFLTALPASAALIILAQPITTLLFNYNKFSNYDVIQASTALQIYTVGLCGFMMVKVLVNSFLSHGNAKIPVNAIIISSVINIILSIILMPIIGMVGIALSTSLSAIINATMLYILGRKKGYINKATGALVPGIRIIFSVFIMCLLLVLVMPDYDQWFAFSIYQRVWNMLLLVTLGVVSYISILLISGWRWQKIYL